MLETDSLRSPALHLAVFNVVRHCQPPQLPPPSSAFPFIMATAEPAPGAEFFFKGETGRNTRGLLRLIILVTIAAAAVAARLFSVIRFESIIHECQSSIRKSCAEAEEEERWNADVKCSRSVVQLPRDEVSRCQWLLQVLGLV